jgi:opacity protein-like surface antigen
MNAAGSKTAITQVKYSRKKRKNKENMHLHNIKNGKLSAMAGIGLLTACALTAQAGDATQGFYMNADGGLNMMTGIRGSAGDGGSNLKLNAGTRWGLEAGYGFKLADQLTLGVEAESGIIWNGFSSIQGGGTETEIGGNAWQVPVLANLVLNYHAGKFTPYIGIGGGLDYFSANIWSDGGSPAVIAGSDWGPAVQAQAGVRYQLSEKTELGLGYKYLTAFSEKVSGDRLSEVNNHTISLSFTYHF